MRDTRTDLAVLKLKDPPKGLVPMPFGDAMPWRSATS